MYSILGCEVTSGISVRTHCVDVFHYCEVGISVRIHWGYLDVRLKQVSLFEPTAWMYSITGLWGYNGYLYSNQLYGCIPLLGCEVTTGISVRTNCLDVFHYLAVRLQQVSLFEPNAWMYSITWLWGYSRYLCSNPLHRCIPLLGCEVTTVYLCSNPLRGCIPLLGCEVTTGISVRTHCVNAFHYLDVRLQRVSLFEPTVWMYSITWLWVFNRYLYPNPLRGCIPLLGCRGYSRYLCSNPLRGCIPLLGCEVTTGISVRTHCVNAFHYLDVRLQRVSLFEPTVWMYSITWLWVFNRYLYPNPLRGCIPLLGCEVTTGISVRTHCMNVFHYLVGRL